MKDGSSSTAGYWSFAWLPAKAPSLPAPLPPLHSARPNMPAKIFAVFAALFQGIVAHLLAAVFILSATGAVEAALLTGPVVNPANGHTYYLLSSNTWTDSENEAVTLGGHLTTINDADENAWVLSTFSFYGGTYKDLWIGLSDFASEGNWVWANGETSSFRNWSVGEPNNGGDQD